MSGCDGRRVIVLGGTSEIALAIARELGWLMLLVRMLPRPIFRRIER